MRIADELQVDCPVFYVDNVAEYYRQFRTDIELNDLPQVTPPFKNMWLEFRSVADDPVRMPWRAAVQMHCMEVTEELKGQFAPLGFGLLPRREARWAVLCNFFNGLMQPARFTKSRDCVLWIDETGKSIGIQGKTDHPQEMSVIKPVLLALSFMHCKNVRHVEHKPDPKLARAMQRRGKRPRLTYYTLEIDPMREVLRREGNVEKVGLKQALHICRGHFKDYRQSGLFGKIKGIFWWGQQLRGTPEAGTVVKDYSVKAPTETVQ